MRKIELKENYCIGFEISEKGVRLIIFQNGIEKACRKEKKSVLKQFLFEKNAQLFKGRLQLIKKENEIVVSLCRESMGNIYYKEFERALFTENVEMYKE